MFGQEFALSPLPPLHNPHPPPTCPPTYPPPTLLPHSPPFNLYLPHSWGAKGGGEEDKSLGPVIWMLGFWGFFLIQIEHEELKENAPCWSAMCYVKNKKKDLNHALKMEAFGNV